MGEIKSTLEIIMEKTKGLTMTEEEKMGLQKREIEAKVKGLLQKFIEGVIDLQRIREGIAGLGQERHQMARKALLEGCLGRIDTEADNERILDVLEQVVGFNTGALRKLLSEFHQDLAKKRDVQASVLKQRLKGKGIWGTAIIPNINADPEWVQYVLKRRDEFQSKLDSVCTTQGS
jgi:hypothetical protein